MDLAVPATVLARITTLGPARPGEPPSSGDELTRAIRVLLGGCVTGSAIGTKAIPARLVLLLTRGESLRDLSAAKHVGIAGSKVADIDGMPGTTSFRGQMTC